MSIENLKQGIFKEELKNRFLCIVEIEGKDALCYIPSSCRLSNFVDLVGKSVMLLPVSSKHSRTKYSVFAALLGRRFVPLNLSKANEVIGSNINSRRFAFLGKRKAIKAEHFIGNYKADFYIEDTKTIVEIKSILSFEKETIFPTVYSQRAIEQLKKIETLMDEGYRACYIFVSMSPSVKQIAINSGVKEYKRLFLRCVEKGMIVSGISIRMQEYNLLVHSNVKILV